MSIRKARDTSTLTAQQQINLSLSDGKYDGIRDDSLYETVPNVLLIKSAVGQAGENNTGIWQSRDQPGYPGSGYGARTGAGQIDIVAGYSTGKVQRTLETNPSDPRGKKLVSVYPDMFNDASRIMVNQLTAPDRNFDCARGNIGMVDFTPAITVKSSTIRMIAKGSGGIKIITGAAKDEKTANNGILRSIPRINFIAGNQDLGGRQSLEPVAKAETLKLVINDIFDQIQHLNSVLDSFMTAQIDFNTVAAYHDHMSPTLMGLGVASSGSPFSINNGKTGISPDLLGAGQKFCAVSAVSKYDGVMQKLQSAVTKLNSVSPAGPKEFGSPSVFTT